MFDLKTYLDLKQRFINKALGEILGKFNSTQRIVEAMRYSLLAGGKRIRPILCMAAAESVGGIGEDVIHEACSIEMIHTYSLIHDDLPAMDNDNLRRGKPTCHKAFDEATAILAGDALLTYAFQILSSNSSLASVKALSVINTIASAAGFKGMIEGQMMDMASEGKQISLDDLKEMHYLKTGALIEASVVSGGILAGGSNSQIENLCNYAKNIGLAFQVADDILNVEGDPLLMGKAVGTDAARKKATYPSLIGMEKSKEMANELVKNSLHAIKTFDGKCKPLREIAGYIINRKK